MVGINLLKFINSSINTSICSRNTIHNSRSTAAWQKTQKRKKRKEGKEREEKRKKAKKIKKGIIYFKGISKPPQRRKKKKQHLHLRRIRRHLPLLQALPKKQVMFQNHNKQSILLKLIKKMKKREVLQVRIRIKFSN